MLRGGFIKEDYQCRWNSVEISINVLIRIGSVGSLIVRSLQEGR
ncbi:hypothetical protein [Candidatus Hodgkinia cicadicola]